MRENNQAIESQPIPNKLQDSDDNPYSLQDSGDSIANN